MKKKLVLVGGGGHCKVCIDVIEQTEEFEIIGILDLPSLIGTTVLGYKVIGSDQDISIYVDKGYSFLVTVGQIKSAILRRKLFEKLKSCHADIATVFSKSSYCSKHTNIGAGTIIMQNVIINAGAAIGDNCILNNGCDIEHDTKIGNHTHISTFAVVNGDCKIGNEVFIGSNATIANKIIIADQTIIGAGSVVIKNVLEKEIQAGNPAQKI